MRRLCCVAVATALFSTVIGAGNVWALDVQCPVCGQTFEEGTGVCPNDGTDLKLLGKLPSTDTDGTEAPDTDTPDADEDAEKKDSAESAPKANGGYRRRDDSGAGKPVDEKNASAGAYSDRQSRLPGDSRTAAPEKRRKKRVRREMPRKDYVNDKAFFADYQRKQQYLWDERRTARLSAAKAGRDREAARRELLNNLAAPITSLGARLFFMGEGRHPGPVSGAEIDVQLSRYRLRAGFSTFLGIRALEDRNELIFLESLSVGAQIPSRFSPFIIAKGGIGLAAVERFETDRAYLLTSIGTEAGVDAWVNPWLSIAPSIGFVRTTMDNVYWYSVTFKLAVGF